MIRHSLFTAALILAASAAAAPKTMAQTVDIPFAGTVGGGCTFDTPIAGILAVQGPVGTPTSLRGDSFINGGSRGKVNVVCSQPASLTVSLPVQTGGPTFTPIFSDASVESPAGVTSSFPGSSPIPLPSNATGTPLEVKMFVDKGSTLQAGNYQYNVTLTIVP
ncbi:hypothetical protein Cylst_0367 [Cylindrospermum stagnale PCC 7417]|uniref:Spore coat protein U domain-containing protein n=1 Tax=Cylindrospermum stagnale PCC 7417 TaxID=56107 RepID=K9WSE8_9NOST|nr:hypothetical protein [Cylindrospermum stagnale]AFZ22724.1 hypothetical protein Cylst_0367 [Cylindrospermum stagnale PCC 7417]